MVFLLSLEGGSSIRDSHSRAEVLSALGPPFLYTVPDLPGARSTQAGRGMFLPASQIHDAGELVGPGVVGRGGATRLSSTLGARTPAKAGGVQMRPCRHGLIGDHTVFHVVPNWRASPKIVAPSKHNCRIARTPRRARGAHTE